MTLKVIGQRSFVDGVTREVFEEERGKYVVEDGEQIDGVRLPPEDDAADMPLIVERGRRAIRGRGHDSKALPSALSLETFFCLTCAPEPVTLLAWEPGSREQHDTIHPPRNSSANSKKLLSRLTTVYHRTGPPGRRFSGRPRWNSSDRGRGWRRRWSRLSGTEIPREAGPCIAGQ
jgi:hypothetical protein